MKDWIPDRAVLLVIAIGLIAILFAATLGVVNPNDETPIPNWAENVLVALVTGALLKLGDLIAAVVALATNRQVERLGTQLGQSQPLDGTVPHNAADAARKTADAADRKADEIEQQSERKGTTE